jgi:hypothetical protein
MNEWIHIAVDSHSHFVLMKSKPGRVPDVICGHENVPELRGYRMDTENERRILAGAVRRAGLPCEPPPQAAPEDR